MLSLLPCCSIIHSSPFTVPVHPLSLSLSLSRARALSLALSHSPHSNCLLSGIFNTMNETGKSDRTNDVPHWSGRGSRERGLFHC